MIMGIKTILLSVVLAHLCAATINDTVTMAKDIMDGFPIGLVFNTTDEAGPTPQTNDTSLFMNGWKSVLDQTQPNEPFYNFIQFILRFMPSFYIFIFLISVPLNVLALVTFTCRIREKKPAVIYMTHLACVDLLFSLLLPLKIHYYFNSLNWVFGEAVCRVVTAAYYYYMYCSILLMMCMSVDRLLGVVFPVRSLTWRSTRNASGACVLVWLLALTGSVPLLLRKLTYDEGTSITCLDTQDFDEQFQVYMYVFAVFICICFFLPLAVTFVNYFTIIYVLFMKSDNVASSSLSSKKQKRATIMAIAVLTGFVVCFVPSNVILFYFCIEVTTGSYWKANLLYCFYLLALCLGSASAFLDPLLYYYSSSQYRKMIRSVLRR